MCLTPENAQHTRTRTARIDLPPLRWSVGGPSPFWPGLLDPFPFPNPPLEPFVLTVTGSKIFEAHLLDAGCCRSLGGLGRGLARKGHL